MFIHCFANYNNNSHHFTKYRLFQQSTIVNRAAIGVLSHTIA
jgi:hypothetical protein